MRARPFFTAATASYLANCALGTSVLTRVLDTRRYRWLHHAMFIGTASLAGLAVASSAFATPRRTAKQSAALLAPAAVPLALIPYMGSRGKLHIVVALTAAPFFLSSVIRAWR